MYEINKAKLCQVKFNNVFHPLFSPVHWDGKIFPDITLRKSVDRLAIIVAGIEIPTIFAVTKLHPLGD